MFFIVCLTLCQVAPVPLDTLIDARLERDAGGLAAWVPRAADLPVQAKRHWLLSLGQIGDPEAAEWIGFYFKDDDLQATALFAYGEIDGAPLAPLLAIADDVSAPNRMLWMEAIAKLARPSDGATITKLWQGLTDQERADALFYLWRVKPDALTAAVLDTIKRSPKATDSGYVFYLYRTRTPVNPALLPLLFTLFKGDPQSLIYALRISPRTMSDRLDRYYAALSRHADWRIRVNALNALQGPAMRKSMGYALLNDTNPNVVSTALRVLMRLNDPAVHENLLAAPQSFSPAQRQLLAATASNNEAAFLTLTKGWLKADDPWRRRQGLALLRKRDDAASAEQLMRVQRRYSTGEAVLALRALTARQATQLDGAIKAAVDSGDPYLMAAAVQALTARDHERPEPVPFARLRQLAERPMAEPDFHYALMDGMTSLTDVTTQMDVLQEMLTHPDYQVRYKAWQTAGFPADQAQAVFVRDWDSQVPPAIVAQANNFLKGSNPEDVLIETTKGTVRLRLEGTWAPITAANLLALAKQGFYNGMPLHRVIPNFVAQMGDNRGDGSGGPGYAIPCEVNPLRYRRGSVGMALAGKDTGGSQFFICHSDQPHLDGGYTIFGQVIAGMDVVDRLEEGDVIERMKTIPRGDAQ